MAVVGSLSSGCAVTTMQTAQTLGEGNLQLALEPGVLAGDALNPDSRGQRGANSTDAGLAVQPAFYVAGRYGLREDLDLGVRLGTIGYEATVKYQLTAPDKDTVISFAPSGALLGLFTGEGTGVFVRAKTPLLFGIPIGDNQLMLAPSLETWVGLAGGGGEAAGGVLILGGQSVGYAVRVSKIVRVMPEVGVSVPLIGGASSSQERIAGFDGGLLVGGSVGLLVGGR